MSVRNAWFIALMALPATALSQIGPGQYSVTVTPLPVTQGPFVQFELRADPATPRATVTAGFSSADRPNQPFAVRHRYFYDAGAHTYFGYDVVLQPGPQPDTWRATYYDLSIGPLDFNGAPPDAIDPTIWKRLPLPAIPAPKAMTMRDAATVEVAVNAATGQKLIDSMTLSPQVVQRQLVFAQQAQQQFQQMSAQLQNLVIRNASPVDRAAPTVSGPVREYTVDDAEMNLSASRVKVNGAMQFANNLRRASGTLVWIYIPKRGRYVLSLTARPDLGFAKAGELRGGVATIQDDHDVITIESPMNIATGDGAYTLYVWHDKEFEPTSQNQGNSILVGSVSPREIVLLKK